MSDEGRHWNYGGLGESSLVKGGSTRKPRKVSSNQNLLGENHRLISDDEDNTDLPRYRSSQSKSYFHIDAGTDVEMDYAASGSLDFLSFDTCSD